MKNKIKYNLEKIKTLPKFNDALNKKLKNTEFKQRHLLNLQRLDLAQDIVKLRQKTSLTQNDLAQKLKTSQSFVARVENGNQNITLDVLIRIANIFSAEQKSPVKLQIAGLV